MDGPKAALFPAPVLQAATRSVSDLPQIGKILSSEAQSKGAQVLLAPTICCLRNPLGGRNFESFSEEPYVSGKLAIEYVAGVQKSGKVVATAKHYVANEQEYHRFSVSVDVEEQALREIHLRPFEMLIKSTYPRGCDQEMPGPPLRRGAKSLTQLRQFRSNGLKLAIDRSCSRILGLAERLGKLGISPAEAEASMTLQEASSTNDEHLRSLRRIATNGMVVLKNDRSLLPPELQNLRGKNIAFVGPNDAIRAHNG